VNEDHAMHAERLLPSEIAPEGYKALRAVEVYLAHSGLPKKLIELVKMRAAQINGCVYCLDVHSSKDARRAGETEARLYLLNVARGAVLLAGRARSPRLDRSADERVDD
jgi:AhpD family alkylhydroperoxidase